MAFAIDFLFLASEYAIIGEKMDNDYKSKF